jgi:hypothetical protein
MAEETLLPGTRMIPRATLEWEAYKGQELVRYRDSKGFVHRLLTRRYSEAEEFFFSCLRKLKPDSAKT